MDLLISKGNTDNLSNDFIKATLRIVWYTDKDKHIINTNTCTLQKNKRNFCSVANDVSFNKMPKPKYYDL